MYALKKKRAGVGNLAYMVFVWAERSLHLLADLLRSRDAWKDVYSFAERYAKDQMRVVTTTTRRITLRVISSYRRRIVDRVESFPYQLLWFGVKGADDQVNARLRVAKKLVDTPSAALHVTARKVKYVFKRQLDYCVASGGRMVMSMFAPFKLLTTEWTAETMAIEGYMSLIQAVATRAPSIKEPMIDARVGNAVDLHMATAESKKQNGTWWNLVSMRWLLTQLFIFQTWLACGIWNGTIPSNLQQGSSNERTQNQKCCPRKYSNWQQQRV
jgi:hypothetical protein